jgi:Na+/proline symporter
MTVVVGLLGVGTALLLGLAGTASAFDTWFVLWGILGGGFAGCYGLGMFTRRANHQGAFIGVVASVICTLVVWRGQLVAPVLYPTFGILACLICGYLGSWFFPAPSRPLLGLTVWDRRPD